MLILTRRAGEEIIINDDIKIIIINVGEKGRYQAKIGIEAPASTKIFRKEVYEKILKSKTPKDTP